MTLFWLIFLPVVGSAIVIGLRRWPIIAIPITASVLVAMIYLALGVSQTQYTFVLGRLAQLTPLSATALAFCYFLTVLLVLAGYRLLFAQSLYAFTLLFIAFITVSVTVQDSSLGALFLSAAVIIYVLIIASSGPDRSLSSLHVLSVLMLVGPLLLITVWALEGRSLNPNDESLIRLGGFSLILAIAIGLGVFPLSFWLPPIFRINNPLAVLLSFILQITLLVRLSSVFTISLWPGGQQVLYSLLVTAGFVTIIGAGVLAVIQESLGGILAYTVIADMGVVLVGIGLGTSSALQTSILHLGLRGLAIAGSSVGVSVLRTYYGTDSVARLKGAWHSNRLAVIGLSLCALSLVGLPFTAGFVSRLTILSMSGTNRVGWVIASIAAGFGPAFAWGRFLIFTRGRVDEAPRRTLLGPSILCVFIGAMLLVIGIYPRVIQLLPAEWLTALARVAMPLIR